MSPAARRQQATIRAVGRAPCFGARPRCGVSAPRHRPTAAQHRSTRGVDPFLSGPIDSASPFRGC
eukprot:4760949-Prymnesium_polylepis.2